MPKQKINKEMVVNAAFELARSEGAEHITVKGIANRLSCSVQPIYSYCKNMECLKQEVAAKAKRFISEYTADKIDPNDLFRSIGHAYVRLAKDEPNIFKLFILHRRINISSLSELYLSETDPNVSKIISEQLNINEAKAKELHLNMLIFTVGIGAIFSTAEPGISAEEIFAQQEKAFQAFSQMAMRRE